MTKSDTPGNAMAAAVLFDKHLAKVGASALQLDHYADSMEDNTDGFTAIRFRGPTRERSEWLAVVSVTVNGVPLVGFHGGATFQETLTGVVARLRNGSIKWREDNHG